jgi:transcriptional regulator with XRE-family HTH domain
MTEHYKAIFAKRLKDLRLANGFNTQREFVNRLRNILETFDAAKFSRWENATETATPDVDELEIIAQAIGDQFVRELLLLDGKNGNEYSLTWIEAMPAGVNRAQAERIDRGIHFLRQMVQTGEALGTYCPGYKPEQVRQAYGDYQFAAQYGAIRFIHVPEDKALAQQVQAAYPDLLRVLVADIPEAYDYDGTPIRADLVAWLAARELFGEHGAAQSGIIGWGSGFTAMRIAQLSANYQSLENKIWLSMMGFPNESRVAYPANGIVGYLSSLHLGSQARLMLDPEHPRAGEQFREDVTGQLGTLILTVNGFGPDNRGGATNFQSLVDGYSQMWQGSPAWYYWKKLSNEERKTVAGEILGALLDMNGQPIVEADPAFTNAINYRSLRALANGVWLVASMTFKAEAVRMAIRCGLARNLVIDASIARALLKV